MITTTIPTTVVTPIMLILILLLIIIAVEVVELVTSIGHLIAIPNTTLHLPPPVVLVEVVETVTMALEMEGLIRVIRWLCFLGKNVATLALIVEGLLMNTCLAGASMNICIRTTLS